MGGRSRELVMRRRALHNDELNEDSTAPPPSKRAPTGSSTLQWVDEETFWVKTQNKDIGRWCAWTVLVHWKSWFVLRLGVLVQCRQHVFMSLSLVLLVVRSIHSSHADDRRLYLLQYEYVNVNQPLRVNVRIDT